MVAETAPQQRINTYIQSMQQQGVLNQHFNELRNIQIRGNPDSINDILTLFCHESENTVAQMNAHLTGPVVDMGKVVPIAQRLKGSSISVGGGQMANACGELREACEQGNLDRSLQIFQRVQHEHARLKACLLSIVQLERSSRGI